MTQPAQAVLDALGITEKYITAADIRLRPNEWPVITLEQHLRPDLFVTRRFQLVPVDEPFDLDRMCSEAMQRLEEGIVESACKAWNDWRLAAGFLLEDETYIEYRSLSDDAPVRRRA